MLQGFHTNSPPRSITRCATLTWYNSFDFIVSHDTEDVPAPPVGIGPGSSVSDGKINEICGTRLKDVVSFYEKSVGKVKAFELRGCENPVLAGQSKQKPFGLE